MNDFARVEQKTYITLTLVHIPLTAVSFLNQPGHSHKIPLSQQVGVLCCSWALCVFVLRNTFLQPSASLRPFQSLCVSALTGDIERLDSSWSTMQARPQDIKLSVSPPSLWLVQRPVDSGRRDRHRTTIHRTRGRWDTAWFLRSTSEANLAMQSICIWGLNSEHAGRTKHRDTDSREHTQMWNADRVTVSRSWWKGWELQTL